VDAATSGPAQQRSPQFAYKADHMIEIDDELISRMIENTLRIGVYGKIEQKKKQAISPKGGEISMFSFNSPDGKSPVKRGSIIATKEGPLTEEEIEKLRRENLELMEELRKY